jgi:uncharacterized protein
MSTDSLQRLRPTPPFWIALAAVMLGFAGGLFVSIMVELIGAAFGSSTSHPTPAVNIVADFLFDGAFVASALYFSVLGGWMGRAEFGYVRITWRRGIAGVLAGGFAYYVVSVAYAAIVDVHGTDKLPSNLGFGSSTWAAVGICLFVCAVAPMAEEFFFRGFLFGVLRWRLGPWLAAVVVGVLFGLAHFDSAQPEYLIPLGFLGFVLCIVRWKTGSLYPCMALHAINNSVAVGVNEGHWGAGPIVALTLGALAVIALVTGPLAVRVPTPEAATG